MVLEESLFVLVNPIKISSTALSQRGLSLFLRYLLPVFQIAGLLTV
jgi:hypothetical protein